MLGLVELSEGNGVISLLGYFTPPLYPPSTINTIPSTLLLVACDQVNERKRDGENESELLERGSRLRVAMDSHFAPRHRMQIMNATERATD